MVWSQSARVHRKDTLALIPPGRFGGAEGIRVHRDASGLVTRFDFLYSAQRDLGALVREYEQALGPAETSIDSIPGHRRTTSIWRDEDTHFILIRLMPAVEGIGGMAFLVDRRRPAAP